MKDIRAIPYVHAYYCKHCTIKQIIFEAKCIILDNLCPIVEKRYWKLFENHYNVNGENESMEEVDMDGSESDQELTGNDTDESE